MQKVLGMEGVLRDEREGVQCEERYWLAGRGVSVGMTAVGEEGMSVLGLTCVAVVIDAGMGEVEAVVVVVVVVVVVDDREAGEAGVMGELDSERIERVEEGAESASAGSCCPGVT